MWLARVGEHHNTPEYSSYAADANTVMAVPADMNVLSACMPEMVRLHDMGRFIVAVAPTASFGLLHPKLASLEGRANPVTVNDILKVDFQGKGKVASKNGRKLVVLSYGPDSKMVTKTIADAGVINYFVFEKRFRFFV